MSMDFDKDMHVQAWMLLFFQALTLELILYNGLQGFKILTVFSSKHRLVLIISLNS